MQCCLGSPIILIQIFIQALVSFDVTIIKQLFLKIRSNDEWERTGVEERVA